jgi:putative hydrolase of the HAD superfamily
LRRKWVASPAVERFETGRCSADEFAAAFIEEWGLRLDPGEFIARFGSWVTGPFPGTAELLSTLQAKYTLACLSNTNAVHWETLLGMEGLRPVLERAFLSHRLGAMKPSQAVYAHVVRELGCEPGEVAFFDDGPENIDGAARAGLSAHLISGPEHLRRVVGDLGLL